MEKNGAGVCWKFVLGNSTVQKICKNRTEIMSAFERNGPKIKRFRKAE